MNNVSPINKAQRLTEAEVHAAAEELQEAGEKVSSIELYKRLGRGSLTTITNFLKTWNQGEEKISTLPALISLPDSLKITGEQLIIKVWTESQKMAEAELQSQREALRHAEAVASEKIEEAQAFSEEQAKQIEELKLQIEMLKKETGDSKECFLNEEKKMRNELDKAKKSETIFEQRLIETEKQLKKAEEKITTLEALLMDNKKFELKAGVEENKNNTLRNDIADMNKRTNLLLTDIEKLKEVKISQDEKISTLTMKNVDLEEKIRKIVILNDELITQRNQAIKEAAKLEGELTTWKTLKPEDEQKNKPIKKRNNKLNYKQVEITDECPLNEILPNN